MFYPRSPVKVAPKSRRGHAEIMLFDDLKRPPGDIALDDLERRRTWAELSDRSARAANLLRDGLGLRPDDHAALLMGNRVEFVELLLGAVAAGVWLTPINWHLAADESAST